MGQVARKKAERCAARETRAPLPAYRQRQTVKEFDSLERELEQVRETLASTVTIVRLRGPVDEVYASMLARAIEHNRAAGLTLAPADTVFH